jgi:hypothetical protein
MHTVRGSSFALYAVGGWHAPIATKWHCAMETDINVDKKFTLPLLFDEDTKNELKGFWYYSYYRQCLYNNGYDFKGNPIPKSTIIDITYSNPYGEFSFPVPPHTTLTTDNTLNVDNHDKLLVSTLTIGNEVLTIHTFLRDEDFTSFESLKNNLQHISLSTADIENSDAIKNANGVDVLRVRDTEGTEGVVFLTPSLHVVYIFGASQLKDTIDTITEGLSTL